MTLSPIDAPVRLTVPDRQEWAELGVSEVCQAADCQQLGTQWHHVFRRTQTAGPVDWVAIDGLVIFNKIRLCLWCHDKINSHAAWVVYDEHGWWEWAVRTKRTEPGRFHGREIVQSKSKDIFIVVGKVKEPPLL